MWWSDSEHGNGSGGGFRKRRTAFWIQMWYVDVWECVVWVAMKKKYTSLGMWLDSISLSGLSFVTMYAYVMAANTFKCEKSLTIIDYGLWNILRWPVFFQIVLAVRLALLNC